MSKRRDGPPQLNQPGPTQPGEVPTQENVWSTGFGMVGGYHPEVLSLRVVCPEDLVDELVDDLVDDQSVVNLMVHGTPSLRPRGRVLEFEVVPEAANRIISRLRGFGIDRSGSIMLRRIDALFSECAREAEETTPGIGAEAVVWESVEVQVRGEAQPTTTFILLTMLASMIAAVGLFTDSVILLVGAMVVGPEYGALAHVAIGLQRRTGYRVREGLRTLAIAFGAAIAATAAMAFLLDATGRIPANYLKGISPNTGFVAHPDLYATIIAVLAAIAGTVSLTQVKSGTLVGVLVSVTTIPAVANLGVAIALQRWHEALGAAGQLALNCSIIIGVGALFMMWQRRVAAKDSRAQRLLKLRSRRARSRSRSSKKATQ